MKKYQQILRVVEYMFCHFLSCGFASFCDFCFALSFVLSFCCHFLFFLSFSHPAQVAGPGADLESQHTSLVVFSSGAGAWIWSLAGKSKKT